MDGTCLAASTVAGEGCTCGDEGMRMEDLAEVGWSAEVDSGGCPKEIECDEVCCQYEMAYQLVLKSCQFPGINIR